MALSLGSREEGKRRGEEAGSPGRADQAVRLHEMAAGSRGQLSKESAVHQGVTDHAIRWEVRQRQRSVAGLTHSVRAWIAHVKHSHRVGLLRAVLSR